MSSKHPSTKRGAAKRPATKAPQQAPKRKKGSAFTALEDDQEAEEKAEGGLNVDWKANDWHLVWKMIGKIQDDPMIRQGLFPGIGAHSSSKQGGGKSKAHWHGLLAKDLFEEHPIYGPRYREAEELYKADRRNNAKILNGYAERVKNKLKSLQDKMLEHNEALGRTGEGIMSKEDVKEMQNEVYKNKFQQILANFPVFFQLKELVATHPNAIRTGLGNSATPLSIDIETGVNHDVSLSWFCTLATYIILNHSMTESYYWFRGRKL